MQKDQADGSENPHQRIHIMQKLKDENIKLTKDSTRAKHEIDKLESFQK